MNQRNERLRALRQEMKREGIDALLIPTADYHDSEYVSDYFKAREYYSGFTGSNGTLVIFMEEAGLFTDGRYFIQAEKELSGSGIDLYRMGEEDVPTIFELLEQKLKSGSRIAADGRVITLKFAEQLERVCEKCHFLLRTDCDLAGKLWKERPKRPAGKIRKLSKELCGENVPEKLERVRKVLEKNGCDGIFLNRLDDIMWLFNIRGEDVRYNPVALSYAFVDKERAVLFLQDTTFSAGDGCIVEDYDCVGEWLSHNLLKGQKIAVDRNHISAYFHEIIRLRAEAVKTENPIEILKAVKNETEIENIRKVYRNDSAAVVKFLYWLKQNIGKVPMTEVSVSDCLHRKREECEGFLEESFPTISAYRENAAMMHYEPSLEHPVKIEAEGTLLVDSGGQYQGGTTDVTRTIVLGEITQKEKLHFTKVACGMLRLSNAKFLEGCTGRNLDILARQPLWELGIDYKCGTGHGIGYMLNVHEGPQAVRYKPTELSSDGILRPGMLLSDEPGVYLEGEYGIRTENVLLVKKAEKTSSGQFLCFEMLTFVPIDLEAVDVSLMEEKDRILLNQYHKAVYETIAPLLTEEEAEWLKTQTAPV